MNKLQQVVWVFLLTLMAQSPSVAVEEAKYTVLLKDDDLEVREYEPSIIAQTLVEDDFEEAGNTAFRKLFDYIAGDNQLTQEVEMTAPVGQTQAVTSKEIDMTAPVGQVQVAGKWSVSFMMPASFTLGTLPKPNNEEVTLERIPARKMASITYSGFWSEEGYLEHKALLQDWIASKNFSEVGEPIWARYNPPIMPWFLRRNEILIPISGFREE